jgi:hypothetical protein
MFRQLVTADYAALPYVRVEFLEPEFISTLPSSSKQAPIHLPAISLNRPNLT